MSPKLAGKKRTKNKSRFPAAISVSCDNSSPNSVKLGNSETTQRSNEDEGFLFLIE